MLAVALVGSGFRTLPAGTGTLRGKADASKVHACRWPPPRAGHLSGFTLPSNFPTARRSASWTLASMGIFLQYGLSLKFKWAPRACQALSTFPVCRWHLKEQGWGLGVSQNTGPACKPAWGLCRPQPLRFPPLRTHPTGSGCATALRLRARDTSSACPLLRTGADAVKAASSLHPHAWYRPGPSLRGGGTSTQRHGGRDSLLLESLLAEQHPH